MHTLRHTFVSQPAMAAVSLREIQELIGHRSYETYNVSDLVVVYNILCMGILRCDRIAESPIDHQEET